MTRDLIGAKIRQIMKIKIAHLSLVLAMFFCTEVTETQAQPPPPELTLTMATDDKQQKKKASFLS